jgi:hypothetical protein
MTSTNDESDPVSALADLNRHFDKILRNFAVDLLGISDKVYDIPPYHGDHRLRWCALISARIQEIREDLASAKNECLKTHAVIAAARVLTVRMSNPDSPEWMDNEAERALSAALADLDKKDGGQ